MTQFIPNDLRDKHIYLPGISGQGKTTTMLAMAKQDIDAGRGVTYIDPSGDAVKKLIHWIPEERKDDAIWLSVRNKIPLDFLSYKDRFGNEDQFEKERVVGDLIYILEKDPANTPQMVPLMRDAIYTFIDLPDRTFLDIYRFFTDETRRKEILHATTDKMRKRWEKMPTDNDLKPLLSRMEIYERVPTLNAIFGTPYPKLNIPEVMRENQILLVDLDDSEAGRLLGQLLVAQFKRAAFARREIRESERQPYCLYCDEFQEFQIPDFEKIITQGRKYQIWLTLANQGLYQLDEKIRQAVMRTGTQIIFNLPPEDARAFKHTTPPDVDLSHLLPFEALYHIGAGFGSVHPILERAPYQEDSHAEYIRENTETNYRLPSTPARYATIESIINGAYHTSQRPSNMVPLKEDAPDPDDKPTLIPDRAQKPSIRRTRKARTPHD